LISNIRDRKLFPDLFIMNYLFVFLIWLAGRPGIHN
jgi:hypothetical protein